jgi:hypothetical protein
MENNIDKFLDDLKDDPSKVYDITPEMLNAIKEKIYPDDITPVKENNRIIVQNVINLREQFYEKLMTTSLISYIYYELHKFKIDKEDRNIPQEDVHPFYLDKDELKNEFDPKELMTICRRVGEHVDILNDTRKYKSIEPENYHLQVYKTLLWFIELGYQAKARIQNVAEHMKENEITHEFMNRNPIRSRIPEDCYIVPEEKVKELIKNFLDKQFSYNPNEHLQPINEEFMDIYGEKRKEVIELTEVIVEKGDEEEYDYLVQHTAFRNMVSFVLNSIKAEKVVKYIFNDDTVKERFRCRYSFEFDMDNKCMMEIDEGNFIVKLIRYVLKNPETEKILMSIINNDAKSHRFINYLNQTTDLNKLSHVNTIPPCDFFKKFQDFYENIYEELRTITEKMYGIKRELEFAIKPIRTFDGDAEQNKKDIAYFKEIYQKEITSKIYFNQFGLLNIISSIPANKLKAEDLLTKEDVISKRILDGMKEDNRLADEILKNDIKKKTAKQIRDTGVFDNYDTVEENYDMGTLQNIPHAVSKREMKHLHKTKGDVLMTRKLKQLDEYKDKLCIYVDKIKDKNITDTEYGEYEELQDTIKKFIQKHNIPDDAFEINVIRFDQNKKMEQELIFPRGDD